MFGRNGHSADHTTAYPSTPVLPPARRLPNGDRAVLEVQATEVVAPEVPPVFDTVGTYRGLLEDDRFRGATLTDAKNRLTAEGRLLAKAQYAAINFGSPDEVRARVAELVGYREQQLESHERYIVFIKENKGNIEQQQAVSDAIAQAERIRQEVPLLDKLKLSVEMQIRNNEAAAIKEELTASCNIEGNPWGEVIPLKDGKIDKFRLNYIAQQVNKGRSSLKQAVMSDPSINSSTDQEIIDEAIRLAELEQLDNIDKSKSPSDKVREMYAIKEPEDLDDGTTSIIDTVKAGILDRLQTETGIEDIPIAETIEVIEGEIPQERLSVLRRSALLASGLIISGVLLFSLFHALGIKPNLTAMAVSPQIAAQASYQTYSRSVGLTNQAIQEDQGVDGIYVDMPIEVSEDITVTERVTTTHIAESAYIDVPEEARERCLTIQGDEAGLPVLVYDEEMVDDETCKEYFPGVNVHGKYAYDRLTPTPGELPQNIIDYVRLPNPTGIFATQYQTGNTCLLTTTTLAMNLVRQNQGLPLIQPLVISDYATLKATEGTASTDGKDAPSVSEVKFETLKFLESRNYMPIDSAGLREEFAIDISGIPLKEIIGDETPIEKYPMQIYQFFMNQLDAGHVPLYSQLVEPNVGHSTVVVGGRISEETGKPELLVFETNGGYTSWNLTKNSWHAVDETPFVWVPIDTNSIGLMYIKQRVVRYETAPIEYDVVTQVESTKTITDTFHIGVFVANDQPRISGSMMGTTTSSTINSISDLQPLMATDVRTIGYLMDWGVNVARDGNGTIEQITLDKLATDGSSITLPMPTQMEKGSIASVDISTYGQESYIVVRDRNGKAYYTPASKIARQMSLGGTVSYVSWKQAS